MFLLTERNNFIILHLEIILQLQQNMLEKLVCIS